MQKDRDASASGKKKKANNPSSEDKKKATLAKVTAAKERAKVMFSRMPKRDNVVISDSDEDDESKVVPRHTYSQSHIRSSSMQASSSASSNSFSKEFSWEFQGSSEDEKPVTPLPKKPKFVSG